MPMVPVVFVGFALVFLWCFRVLMIQVVFKVLVMLKSAVLGGG
jgi:hypothetical protein